MDGYWGSTSYGPTWYGNEPYAPYVYHYGNWIYTARYGWVWIPGYDYHPGRVSWSYGGDYIGWRPQFPSGYNYPGSDYNFWVVIDRDRFGYNSYRPYALRSTVVRDLFARRVFRTRHDRFGRDDLERIVRRPLRRLNVREREIRIGDRRARLIATDDDEVRIRKHVERVRVNRRDDDRRDIGKNTVMKRKFEDIRTKSTKDRRSDDVRKVSRDRKDVDVRKTTPAKRFETSRGSKKIESSKSKKIESRSTRKPAKVEKRSIEKRSHEKVHKSQLSSRKSDRDQGSVKKASVSSRKPAKVEKTKFSVRKSEVRSHAKKADVSRVKSSGKKADVSKGKSRDRKSVV